MMVSALRWGGEGIDVKTNCFNGFVHHNHVYDLPKDYDPAVHKDGEVGIYIDGYSSTPPDHLYNVDVYQNIVSTPVGIAIGAEQGGTVENIRVFNNIVYDCYDKGITITNWVSPNTGIKKHIYIINNTVCKNGYYTTGGWPSGGGIYIESKIPEDEDFQVRNNILSKNIGYQLKVNTEALDNTIAEYNLIDDFVGNDSKEILGENPILGDPIFYDFQKNNYLIVSSSTPITLIGGQTTTFDFTTGPEQYHDPSSSKQIDLNLWGMIAGDVNQDGYITSLDYTIWYNDDFMGLMNYSSSDLNFDGRINHIDYGLWLVNSKQAFSSW